MTGIRLWMLIVLVALEVPASVFLVAAWVRDRKNVNFEKEEQHGTE